MTNYTDTDALGPCGCTDYHMSDCPTRTGGSSIFDDDPANDDSWFDREYDVDDDHDTDDCPYGGCSFCD